MNRIHLSACCCLLLGAASAAETRMLIDFEKESVAKWTKFKAESDDAYEASSGGAYTCGFNATRGPAASGAWALTHKFDARSGVRWHPGYREGQHLVGRKLFSSSYALAKFGPTDWSGYDAISFDVYKDKPGAVGLAIALEDRVIVPPVVRRVRWEKEGAWHSVYVPLAPLADLVNLKEMVNLFVIVEDSPDKVELRMDDLRLLKGPKPDGKDRPLLEDATPAAVSHKQLVADLAGVRPDEAKHNVYKVEGEVQPAAPAPGADARAFTAPKAIEAFGRFENPGGNTRRSYPYGLEMAGDNQALIRYPTAGTAQTLDGGKTWTKLRAGFGGVNNWRSEVSGDRGELLYVGLGQCCGGGSPSTFYFRRVFAGPEGWQWGPAYPVDRDTRHCEDHFDLVRLDSGRLWVAWNHCQRFGGYGLHARYSDDDGKTWLAAGPTALVPGSLNKCNLSTDPQLAPFKDGVAVLWPSSDGQAHMTPHDGKQWGACADLGGEGMASAASPDGKTLFAVLRGPKGGPPRLLKSDGGAWQEDAKPPTAGLLTAQRGSGALHHLWVERTEGKRRVMLATRTNGAWTEGRAVFEHDGTNEEDTDLQISISRWSPDAFVPVAVLCLQGKTSWKDVRWIQVLKVPAGNGK